jgi:hypothetical protein
VAIEVIRDHDARDRNWEAKLHAYCQLGVGELVRFDPEGTSGKLRVWDRIDNDLTEREPSDASMPSNVLPGFWLLREDAKLGPSVRLSRDPEGRELYLTPGEADAQRIRELEAELSRRGG